MVEENGIMGKLEKMELQREFDDILFLWFLSLLDIMILT